MFWRISLASIGRKGDTAAEGEGGYEEEKGEECDTGHFHHTESDRNGDREREVTEIETVLEK